MLEKVLPGDGSQQDCQPRGCLWLGVGETRQTRTQKPSLTSLTHSYLRVITTIGDAVSGASDLQLNLELGIGAWVFGWSTWFLDDEPIYEFDNGVETDDCFEHETGLYLYDWIIKLVIY